MQLLDYITIGLFTLGILIAGLSFSKSGKNMKSFFAAGGQVPWAINGLSLFMGFFSAGTFVVWGSIAYSYGWVAITIQTAMCLAGFGVGFFIAPRWRATGVMTAAEYISRRLGISVQKMYTYLFLLISMFTTGSFSVSGSKDSRGIHRFSSSKQHPAVRRNKHSVCNGRGLMGGSCDGRIAVCHSYGSCLDCGTAVF